MEPFDIQNLLWLFQTIYTAVHNDRGKGVHKFDYKGLELRLHNIEKNVIWADLIV